MIDKNLTPTPDEIMKISPLTPNQVNKEILKTLQSTADTLNAMSRTLEEIRYLVSRKG